MKRLVLESQLEELYRMLPEIEETLNTQYERSNGRFLQIITVYGFPFTIITTVYQAVIQEALKSTNMHLDNFYWYMVFFIIGKPIFKLSMGRDSN